MTRKSGARCSTVALRVDPGYFGVRSREDDLQPSDPRTSLGHGTRRCRRPEGPRVTDGLDRGGVRITRPSRLGPPAPHRPETETTAHLGARFGARARVASPARRSQRSPRVPLTKYLVFPPLEEKRVLLQYLNGLVRSGGFYLRVESFWCTSVV